jgi:hypothetical protein
MEGLTLPFSCRRFQGEQPATIERRTKHVPKGFSKEVF